MTLSATDRVTRRGRHLWRTPEFTLGVIVATGFLALAFATGGNLLSAGTLEAFFRFLAVPIVIGLSQMVVLAVGQMNLSVGALTGFCAMAAAWLMIEAGFPAPVAVPAALLLGLVAGLINGALVVLTRINGFIVTLATMTIIQGLRYGVNGPDTYQGYSEGLRAFGRASILGLPAVFLVAIAVAVAVALFFSRTVTGRQLLASGGSPFAARLSGISNDRSVIIAHGLSGLLAGVAAVITVSASGSVNATIGDDLLLPSFAAPIIGGVALTGGMVSVAGTVLAAFLVRLVDVMQAQFGINPRWVDLIIGAVVLGAVLLGTIRQRVRERST
ncbi:ABC transporter permease [Actinoplanes italicus]|uniref:Monosaccharide ABC transporter membrane protein (CUT2 family) n=1 Tax=Actinoplanes italicus TaxID=113567 RepID=A0A2T0K937_9ACTN|nr:ABC transporter permease [Actinoplanes italicus]PRX19588.1 monosaccharide ABC transporter membrane protein (CUT2 family) [Actinoplanes italicus]GIE30401.1 ABC transporter permease [Actinoplanes italicus]